MKVHVHMYIYLESYYIILNFLKAKASSYINLINGSAVHGAEYVFFYFDTFFIINAKVMGHFLYF